MSYPDLTRVRCKCLLWTCLIRNRCTADLPALSVGLTRRTFQSKPIPQVKRGDCGREVPALLFQEQQHQQHITKIGQCWLCSHNAALVVKVCFPAPDDPPHRLLAANTRHDSFHESTFSDVHDGTSALACVAPAPQRSLLGHALIPFVFCLKNFLVSFVFWIHS